MISRFLFGSLDSQYFEIGYKRRRIPENPEYQISRIPKNTRKELGDTTLGAIGLSQWLCYKEKTWARLWIIHNNIQRNVLVESGNKK